MTEGIFSALILVILLLLVNPTHILMPESLNSWLVLALIVSFLAFAAVFWKESPQDERDTMHILRSGRSSFFAGSAILVIGIVLQASVHSVDPWLVVALSGMVLVKFAARWYSGRKN